MMLSARSRHTEIEAHLDLRMGGAEPRWYALAERRFPDEPLNVSLNKSGAPACSQTIRSM